MLLEEVGHVIEITRKFCSQQQIERNSFSFSFFFHGKQNVSKLGLKEKCQLPNSVQSPAQLALSIRTSETISTGGSHFEKNKTCDSFLTVDESTTHIITSHEKSSC